MSDQTDERPVKTMSTADLAGMGRPDLADTAANLPAGHDGAELPASTPARPASGTEARPTPLLVEQEATDMRARWSAIQIGFVDDPRHAVEMADSLVAEVMQRLAQLFAHQRGELEGQWSRGEDVSTEDLRLALRQYRSFFDRLLTI